ncbi:efflux RND transporter permease subunit [Colwellia sp. M166]|uniref:efflux RND transporter permease subunit n=1 Tax=Colwellia sp. M166 TaxID=2583805 RepID=UPI00211EAC88|nr:efflux RND transporter permease subunit [Colwellia sp. M166]UUO22299.1 efflux RND transporter permease subunit [Colwellia sp. M166]|tara:strand:+ start:16953 stop:20051 length:3099 start_codon:yes stop_codon:yes gene_type:complete
MIAWFAKNHVAANLLMISILLAGIFSVKSSIPLEVFPSFESEIVNVTVVLRGSTPEDAEQGVAIRIEEAVQDLQGIEEITSTSVEGAATVRIEADSSTDVRDLLADIKSRVDAINTFPVDAEKPVIAIAQRIRDVISVTISSEYGEKEIREFAEQVRDDLLRLPQVTQVALDAVRDYEISIDVNQSKLEQYQLTLAEISTAISNSSVDISAGNVRTDGGDVLVRNIGQAYRRDEFEKVVIKTNTDGTFLYLEDIAQVNDGFEETPLRARFNGQQGALIDVFRIGNQSAIDVADAVKNYIDERQDTLPQGFVLSYWDDDSEIVKSRLNTLITNALQGGFLVLLLLTLFLRPSIAFWVSIGIPVSFMGAFIVMPFFDISINIMSLFGFILVLGIVVDDAIVTGENIYRHTQTASSGLEAAIKGTEEVATPVTFGILTTVAAFLPLAFIEGQRGALFAQIPVIVIPVLLFSLIESKFVLPSHLKSLRLRSESTKQSKFSVWQQGFADGFENAILKYYKPLLALAIKNRLTTIALFVGVFILILAFIMSGWTRFVFFPRIASETARGNITMPVGTSFDVVDAYVDKMSKAAKILQDKYRDENGESIILNTLAITSEEKGRVRFEIVPADENDSGIGTAQLVKEWRELIGPLPGAESVTFRAELGRGGDPIDIQLSATDLKTLEKVAEEVKARIRTYPTAFEIADSLSNGKEELQIELTAQGYAMGMSNAWVTRQVRDAYFGSQIQRIQRGRDDVRVMLRFPLSERQSISKLNDMLINTPTGGKVPLSHVATLKPGKSASAIKRIDRYRTVNVTADIDKNTTNMTILNADLKQFLTELMNKYPGVSYSLEGEAREQADSFSSLAWGLVFVFFIIYCLLAIPFKSYVQPLIVMSVIPFGAIGAIVGHWIMGMDLTIMSLLGLMALIGVVVNDSLVLVDFINAKVRLGEKAHDAVLMAAQSRFRPVMLTSLTTFIGLMPLLFEKATQAQFLIPMAVSLGFGIIFATFITLILVPVNYLLVEDMKSLTSRSKEKLVNQLS